MSVITILMYIMRHQVIRVESSKEVSEWMDETVGERVSELGQDRTEQKALLFVPCLIKQSLVSAQYVVAVDMVPARK